MIINLNNRNKRILSNLIQEDIYFTNFLMIFSKINYCLLFSLLISGYVQLFVTPWTAACQTSLSFTISRCLLKLKSLELVMPMNHVVLSSPYLPAFYFSQHQGSFPMSWLFASGGQGIGASASALVLPVNIQD